MTENPNPVQIQRFLSGADYPVGKDELLRLARNEGADDNVMQALRDLPEREYDGPNAVSAEIANRK